MNHTHKNKSNLWELEEHILATLKHHDYYQNHKLKAKVKHKLNNEKGLGTVEIIIILAVLVALALAFQSFAKKFFTDVRDSIQDPSKSVTIIEDKDS
jgi:hypothetical protein